jgi:hypothetical protein
VIERESGTIDESLPLFSVYFGMIIAWVWCSGGEFIVVLSAFWDMVPCLAGTR